MIASRLRNEISGHIVIVIYIISIEHSETTCAIILLGKIYLRIYFNLLEFTFFHLRPLNGDVMDFLVALYDSTRILHENVRVCVCVCVCVCVYICLFVCFLPNSTPLHPLDDQDFVSEFSDCFSFW